MHQVRSVGQINKALGVEVHKILYAIRSRGIVPVGKVGSANAFDEAAVERIKTALEAIEAGKNERAPAVGAGA